MNKIIVIAAVVDTQCLTLYTPEGDMHVILQGDPRVPVIVKKLQPVLTGPGTSMEIDLDDMNPMAVAKEPEVKQESALNQFAEFEKQSGVAKFFKVAKTALKKFFGASEPEPEKPVEIIAPMEMGEVKTFSLASAMVGVDQAADLSYGLPAESEAVVKPISGTPMSSIDEVMANAKAIPASSEDFAMTRSEEETHDVVAVVEKADGSVGLVPHAHKLATQVAHATKTGNSKGMNALLKRLAEMPKSRTHSVEDLLKFLERGDLPITDDGRIVFYKILRKKTGRFGYVDCHTGRVQQGANVEVRMTESLVDPNRHNECSNGLHVARRQYLSSFSGDVCFLGSLAPEDVVAVPDYDANKMRVCAYQLHFLLSAEDFNHVKVDRPFTADREIAKKLAIILAGNQPPITHMVTIGSSNGGDLTITKIGEEEAVEEVDLSTVEAVASIEEKPNLQPMVEKPKVQVRLDAERVDPTAIAKAQALAKEELSDEPVSQQRDTFKAKGNPQQIAKTPREKIAAILTEGPLDAERAKRIYVIKKAAKKGYHKLGVDAETEKKIKALLSAGK